MSYEKELKAAIKSLKNIQLLLFEIANESFLQQEIDLRNAGNMLHEVMKTIGEYRENKGTNSQRR